MVTDQSDAAFEAMVQGFCKAVLADDKAVAAKYVSFPLRVNQGVKHRSMRTAAEHRAMGDDLYPRLSGQVEERHTARPEHQQRTSDAGSGRCMVQRQRGDGFEFTVARH